jgi:FkbM family methyltransferase
MSRRSRGFRRWLRALVGRDVFQRPQCRLPMLTLGRGHGRWSVWPDVVRAETVVYSFGVGREVSFERDLIERFGVTVQAFDPTPLSLEWARQQALPPRFVLHEVGIAEYDGVARFAGPAQADWESFSMVRRTGLGEAVEAPVARLATLVARVGGPPPDLLKLDIEGAEYRVLPELLASGFCPRQILVEWHHRWTETGPRATRQAIRQLNAAGYLVASVSDNGREYTFVREPPGA